MDKEPPQPIKSYPVWLGFAVKEPTNRGTLRLKLRWGRIMVLLFSLAVMGWAGKSVAAYYFFHHVRNFKEVAFSDMLLFPMNRSSVIKQQGDYQIQKGLEALERKDYGRAIDLLRLGVARSPENVEGRLTLAKVYAGWRPELSKGLLLDGLELGKEDKEYVTLLCQLLAQMREDEVLLETTKEILNSNPKEEIENIAALSYLSIAILRGEFEEAQEIFDSTNIKNTVEGLLLAIDLYNRIGQFSMAEEILVSILNSQTEDVSPVILGKLIETYQLMGDETKAREFALRLAIVSPMDWQPRVRMVGLLDGDEFEERRKREIEAILRQHRNDEVAMTALGQICASQGNTRTTEELYELALENDYDLGVFSLFLIESYLTSGDYSTSISLANELVKENPKWLSDLESIFNIIRSLAYFGGGNDELGNLYLKNFKESRQSTSNQIFQAAKSFARIGFDDQALQLLEEAYIRESNNETVLVDLIDMQMKLGISRGLKDHLEKLFNLRRPSYAMIDDILAMLQSDRFIFVEDRMALLSKLQEISSETKDLEISIWERVEAGS